jgi:hypothetical protein
MHQYADAFFRVKVVSTVFFDQLKAQNDVYTDSINDPLPVLTINQMAILLHNSLARQNFSDHLKPSDPDIAAVAPRRLEI